MLLWPGRGRLAHERDRPEDKMLSLPRVCVGVKISGVVRRVRDGRRKCAQRGCHVALTRSLIGYHAANSEWGPGWQWGPGWAGKQED